MFRRTIFIKHLWTAASEFTGDSHSSYPLFPSLYMVTLGKWILELQILKINFSIIRYDDHVVRYGFVRWVDNQSVLMAVNLFLHVHLIYYTHKSLT